MFADMKCNDLDAFIMAHQDSEKPEFTAKSKIPKKGTLAEALIGERNKILIAFDCRQIKNSIGSNIPQDTEISNDENQSIVDQLGVFAVSLRERDGDMVLPSQLLSDERWVRFVVLLLDLENLNVSMTITEQQKIKADHLIKILRDRFQQHLIRCIKDKCKCTHWSMHFAYSNLAVSVACIVLSNHTVDELHCLQDLDSLLSPTPYNFYCWDPTSDVAKMLDRSWTNGGLLIDNKKETKQIKSSMGKALTDMQKFHDMCAYQFELG
jgi:hypothetical protein